MNANSNGFRSFALVMGLILLFSWIKLEKPASDDNSGNLELVSGDGLVAVDEATGDAAADATGTASGAAAGTSSGKKTTSAGGGTTAGRAATGGTAGGTATGGRAGGSSGGAGGTAGGGTAGGGSGSGSGGNSDLQCAAGKNGGDLRGNVPGVSATKIKLATTAVLDGPAKTLLESSVTGMKAVLDKVNRAGGICGRTLELKVVNDNFNAAQGQQYIRNFIAEDYFALPVVPSAEGLGAAIKAEDISRAGIPVVGTDGMRVEQYTDPWVWPVASATVTAMRTMVRHAATAYNAKTFAIVYDEKYQFGKEGLEAFKRQVTAEGGTLKFELGLNPDQGTYGGEKNQWQNACGAADDPKCDMVALLLLPDTAKQWLGQQPTKAAVYQAGAQTLFTDKFAKDCVQSMGSACNGIEVWTGYNPPIGALATTPGVAAYVSDVKRTDQSVETNNQFLMGAYLGMSVFVEALKKVGPNLSRAAVRDAMNSMTFQTDLTSTLTWTAGDHKANKSSQSFAMRVGQGSFQGWEKKTGFQPDPGSGLL